MRLLGLHVGYFRWALWSWEFVFSRLEFFMPSSFSHISTILAFWMYFNSNLRCCIVVLNLSFVEFKLYACVFSWDMKDSKNFHTQNFFQKVLFSFSLISTMLGKVKFLNVDFFNLFHHMKFQSNILEFFLGPFSLPWNSNRIENMTKLLILSIFHTYLLRPVTQRGAWWLSPFRPTVK